MNIAHVIDRFRGKHHYATVRLKAVPSPGPGLQCPSP